MTAVVVTTTNHREDFPGARIDGDQRRFEGRLTDLTIRCFDLGGTLRGLVELGRRLIDTSLSQLLQTIVKGRIYA